MTTLHPTSVRKSLPLSAQDLDDLATIQASPEHRAALARLVGDELGASASDRISEARLLHAVLAAGVRAIQEQVEQQGYARIAAQQTTKFDTQTGPPIEVAARKASARRRRPTWADE